MSKCISLLLNIKQREQISKKREKQDKRFSFLEELMAGIEKNYFKKHSRYRN